jgi:hypothetical protein
MRIRAAEDDDRFDIIVVVAVSICTSVCTSVELQLELLELSSIFVALRLNCHSLGFSRQVLREIKRHCALTNGIHANARGLRPLAERGLGNLQDICKDGRKATQCQRRSLQEERRRVNVRLQLSRDNGTAIVRRCKISGTISRTSS